MPRATCRSALDEFHDEVIRPDVIQMTDVRMVQRGDGQRLALESIAEPRVDRFDRNRALQTGVEGFVDFAHPAHADAGGDFVRTETSTGSERQAAVDYSGRLI
jgi:hypothetical protein